MFLSKINCIVIIAVTVFMMGCQITPASREARTQAAETILPPLPSSTAQAYRIINEMSELRILVFRGGALAKYGHNHVISTSEIRGTLYKGNSAADSGFELTLPVDAFVVDDLRARQEEGQGFDTVLSDEARAATLENMLGDQLLQAGDYPDIYIRSVSLSGPLWNPDAVLRITIRDQSRDLTTPVSIVECTRMLIVQATFTLRQSEFGITPYTALGGGLRVEDEVRIRVRLVAIPEN